MRCEMNNIDLGNIDRRKELQRLHNDYKACFDSLKQIDLLETQKYDTNWDNPLTRVLKVIDEQIKYSDLVISEIKDYEKSEKKLFHRFLKENPLIDKLAFDLKKILENQKRDLTGGMQEHMSVRDILLIKRIPNRKQIGDNTQEKMSDIHYMVHYMILEFIELEKDVEKMALKLNNSPKTDLNEGNKVHYELVKTDRYAQGIAEMRQKGGAFTFKETMTARLLDWQVNKDNKLFNTYSDTCTGIAYGKSGEIVIIPKCKRLLDIPDNFNKEAIVFPDTPEGNAEFEELKKQGIQLSRDSSFNKLLSRDAVKENKGWIAAFEGDKKLLSDYADMWFNKKYGRENDDNKTGMTFWLIDTPKQNQLRALVASYDINYSVAYGNYNLSNDGRFVSGSPRRR